VWYFLLIILSWLPILAEHSTAVLLFNYFSYFTVGHYIDRKQVIICCEKWLSEEKGKNKKNLKILFYSKVFLNLCFTFFCFYYSDFFSWLPFSILHFFLFVCLSVCLFVCSSVRLFVQFSSFCLYVCLKVCLHVLTTFHTVFICSHEWMNDCSICVFVLSVWLSFCVIVVLSVGEKGWINLFAIHNWFLIVWLWANLIICLFVSLFE
jgi:hypothetical protein